MNSQTPTLFDKRCAARHQQGAVAIMMAVFIAFVALACGALAIDTGRLYLEQRSLQRIADSIALDTAHQSALCGAGELNTDNLQQIAEANGFEGTLGEADNQVLLGWLDADEGRWRFNEDNNPETAEAVHVELSRAVPASLLLGGLIGQNVTLTKQATARRIPQATIRVGSGLISLDTQDSEILNAVFGGLLDSSVSLDAVSYEGLANARISLTDLLEAEGSAGTVDELLSSSLSLGEALELFAEAASRAGVATVGLEGLLEAGGAVESVELTLADILSVESPTSEAALAADAGLLDLISAAILFANKDSAVNIPLGVNLTVPGLTDVSAALELDIVEAPQIAVGPPGRDINGDWRTETRTAQVRANTSVIAEATVLGLISAKAMLGTVLQAARSDAWFEGIECSTYSRQMFQNAVIGTQSTLTTLNLNSDPGASDILEIDVLGGLASVTATLNVDDSPASMGGNSSEAIFCADGYCSVHDLPQVESTGSSVGALLGNALAALVNSLDIEVSITLGPLGVGLGVSADLLEDALLEELLVPLLTGLDDLLTPVLEALGISVGNTDVTLIDAELERVELVR